MSAAPGCDVRELLEDHEAHLVRQHERGIEHRLEVAIVVARHRDHRRVLGRIQLRGKRSTALQELHGLERARANERQR